MSPDTLDPFSCVLLQGYPQTTAMGTSNQSCLGRLMVGRQGEEPVGFMEIQEPHYTKYKAAAAAAFHHKYTDEE